MTYNVQAIIFDLDGTLADNRHRLHYVTGVNKNWPAFFDGCRDDAVYGYVVELYRVLVKARYTIILCSGRPDSHREMTVEWLNKWVGLPYRELLMRKTGDYRADYVVKKEMLDDLRARHYSIQFAIDDRPDVVKMWRENSVPCFQVDDGAWHNAKEAAALGVQLVKKALL